MPNHAPVPEQPASARLFVITAAVLQIATPLLPSLGFGEPIGSQSNNVRTLITPAGWAFSIWGALYTGSLAFAIYQLLPAQRDSRMLDQVRLPAAGAFLGNAVWAAYVQPFGLTIVSTAIIAFTLVCLLTILQRLSAWRDGFDAGERWLVVLPLSGLAAWLTAATIVNIAASLRYHGVDAGDAGPIVAALIILVGGAIVTAALLRIGGNPAYAIVFLWALSAIFAAGGQRAPIVGAAAIVAAVAVAAAALIGLRGGGAAHWLSGRPRSGTVGAR